MANLSDWKKALIPSYFVPYGDFLDAGDWAGTRDNFVRLAELTEEREVPEAPLELVKRYLPGEKEIALDDIPLDLLVRMLVIHFTSIKNEPLPPDNQHVMFKFLYTVFAPPPLLLQDASWEASDRTFAVFTLRGVPSAARIMYDLGNMIYSPEDVHDDDKEYLIMADGVSWTINADRRVTALIFELHAPDTEMLAKMGWMAHWMAVGMGLGSLKDIARRNLAHFEWEEHPQGHLRVLDALQTKDELFEAFS